MSLRKVLFSLALLALGASLPVAWDSLRQDTICAPDDAACLLRKAALLLDSSQKQGEDALFYGEQSYERRETALKRLAAHDASNTPSPATVEDLSAALSNGTLPASTDEELWTFVLRAFRELRGADAATSRATLDLFETHADQIRTRASHFFEEMLVWLAVNDIDRLARLVRYDDLEGTGGEFNEQAEFVRASLLVHDCQKLRASGQDPGIGLSDRMKSAGLGFSIVNLRDMPALGIILHCDGEPAAKAALQMELAWISADNPRLRDSFTNPTETFGPQDAVDQVAWKSFLLSFPVAGWLIAQGRPSDARAIFDALQPGRIAAPLAAIGPEVPDWFDHQFLTWGAFVDLIGRNRLYVAPSDIALSHVATEFDPAFRSETRDSQDVTQALDLIEASWPSGAAQSALWRLGQAATNASKTEVLRLTTLLRLVALDRTMGCDLPDALMTEVRDRVEGTGFGGSRMTRLERAELAVSAAEVIRKPQPSAVKTGYLCIYPQLKPLWQYSPDLVELIYSKTLPIRD